MRSLKRLFLLLFVVIIGLPIALGGAALIKDEDPPAYLVDFDQSFNSQDVVMKKLNNLAIANVLGVSSIYIDEETVNKMIYDNANGFQDAYYEISPGQDVKVDYVWTHFNNNQLSIYALIRYQKVSTTITLKLGFSELTDGVKVSIDQFKIGKLPIPNSMMSYALNMLENYAGFNLKEDYTYGELNYDHLYITIGNQYIQDAIDENLNNNMILFDSIELNNKQFILNYDFNTDQSTDAEAISAAVTEINTILSSDEKVTDLKTDVSGALSNPTSDEQKAFKDDFDAVIDMLQTKVKDTNNLPELTNEDESLMNDLGSSFSNLDADTQEAVATALEGNIDPDVLTKVDAALQNLGVEGYDSFTDLLVGTGQ